MDGILIAIKTRVWAYRAERPAGHIQIYLNIQADIFQTVGYWIRHSGVLCLT